MMRQIQERSIRSALTGLADYLRGDLDLIAELDAKFFSSGATAEGPEDGNENETIPQPDCAVPFNALCIRQFYYACEVLREHGMVTEANRILELYDNSSENTQKTLEYVEDLLMAPEPQTAVGGRGDGNSTEGDVFGRELTQPNCSNGNKTANRKKRGRPKASEEDLKKRANVYDAWQTKKWGSRHELAEHFGVSLKEVARMLNSEGQARRRSQKANSSPSK